VQKAPSFEAWGKTNQLASLAVKAVGNGVDSDVVAESKSDAAGEIEVNHF
jgi:hypothetical protein